MNQISKIKGPPVLLATDAIDRNLLQEAIQNDRLDVVKWLIKEELVYISHTVNCDGKFTLLNTKDTIWETLQFLDSINYSVVTIDLRYADMHKAIGEPDVLNWLLRHGGNIKELDRNGSTLLHLAVEKKLFDVFYLLIELGADIDAEDSYGDTPLHLSVENNEEMTHYLIQQGCNIDAQNHAGWTPLLRAVTYNRTEIVCMLLYYNADVEIPSNNSLSPFIQSVRLLNNNNISEILLEYAYDINAATNRGYNALFFAAIHNNPLETEIIRRGGLLPNGRLLLYHIISCAVGHRDIITFPQAMFRRINEPRLRFIGFCCFLTYCSFPTEEWIKHLYLFLNSEFVDILFIFVAADNSHRECSGDLFTNVVLAFNARGVKVKDRVKILKLLFELRIEIKLAEICKIYDLYGFNDEFELLFKIPLNIMNKKAVPYNFMVELILDLESFANDRLKVILADYLSLEFGRIDRIETGDDIERGILKLGTFVSLRQHVAKLDNSHWTKNDFRIKNLVKVINEMPNIPSLQELSRNALRAAIGRKFPRNIPSFYQRYLEKLPVPTSIVNIIRLKVPLYEDFMPLLLRLNGGPLNKDQCLLRLFNGFDYIFQ